VGSNQFLNIKGWCNLFGKKGKEIK
jgi:hypothetical protein